MSPVPELINLRGEYERDGYAIMKDVFRNDSLETMRQSLRNVLETLTNKIPSNGCTLDELILSCEEENHSIVYKGSQSVGSSAATYELIGSSKVLDRVSSATGYDKSRLHLLPLYLIVQLPSDERFDYAWHQDGSFYPWCDEFLTLWFPVNRATNKDSGTISMIPGSHHGGPRETNEYLKHGFFKQLESKVQKEEENRESVLEIELGDCCVMHGNTVHRSVANRSESPRVAGVLRMAHLCPRQAYERQRFYCVHKF